MPLNNYITIDGGTTNTRLFLVCGEKVTDSVKYGVGARDCIDSPLPLKAAIKEGIKKLLDNSCMCDRDITAILASGMITGEQGLCTLRHIAAPAGVKELHRGMAEMFFEDISPIPFYFIPGVIVRSDSATDTDMMRGEETETVGLCAAGSADSAYLLPGSHSKLITIDGDGRIDTCRTYLTGEMLAALAGHTVLKASVSLDTSDFDREFLFMGYDAAVESGLNAAVFKTRILKNIFGEDALKCYSYFLGAVLAGEIENIKKCGKKHIYIGGKDLLRLPMEALLKQKCGLDVTLLDKSICESSTAMGAVKIFEHI